MPPDLASHEQGRMQGFVTALLRHEGALVETIDPEGLEVLAPPSAQQTLGIGELARLGFGTTLPSAAHRVGLEGDWLARFARLLGSRGRFGRRVMSSAAKAPGDPERLLSHELVLDNATFRLLEVAPVWNSLSGVGLSRFCRVRRQARLDGATRDQPGDGRSAGRGDLGDCSRHRGTSFRELHSQRRG